MTPQSNIYCLPEHSAVPAQSRPTAQDVDTSTAKVFVLPNPMLGSLLPSPMLGSCLQATACLGLVHTQLS